MKILLNLDLTGMEDQDMSCSCPNCDYWMEAKYIIGFGNYPENNYRGMLKPNQKLAMAFECPECFTKSFCHCGEEWIELVENLEVKNEYHK
jgi:hypothetical protein